MNKPQVLILAGGEGKRFAPLTTDKSIFPFLGQPLIAQQIKLLREVGFKNLKIVVNLENKQKISQVAEQFKNLNISLAVQKEAKGMGKAVLAAEEILDEQPLIVINSGDLLDKGIYQQLLQMIEKENPQGIIPGYQISDYFPGGYLALQGKYVRKIVEKPGKGNQPSQLVNLVVHYYRQPENLLQKLRETETDQDDHYEQAMYSLMQSSNVDFRFLPYEGVWAYLKYPWHVLNMSELFLEKALDPRNQAEFVSPAAVIEGPVHLSKGVRVLAGVKIKGPCFLGENVLVGNNSLVRESMIGKNSVIGSNTEIARSYVGRDCWFHRNYLGDSVVEENVSLGSGAVTANFRLDEQEIKVEKQGKEINLQTDKFGAVVSKNVRIGVNTSLMPGVLIGKGTFISAGLVIDQNIPENKFCKHQRSSFQIVDNKRQVGKRKEIQIDE